ADEVTLAKIQELLSSVLISYSKFNITLKEALNIQMDQLQQTDKYRNEKAFVYQSDIEVLQTAAVQGDGVRLRTKPNFDNNIKYTVNNGTKVTVIKMVEGASYASSTKWYEIEYRDNVLYVHSSLVNPKSTVAKTINKNTNVYSKASKSSHVYGIVSKGKEFEILNKEGTWYEIKFTTWRNPTYQDVEFYLNPANNDQFQHLVLSASVGVSSSQLNKVLTGKGILNGKGQAFINGGREHGVNEVYLISHALLETSHGTSRLSNGIEVGVDESGNTVLVTLKNRGQLKNIKKVYNMFGIGAIDGDAERMGAIRAYKEGWFTPEAAIIGGAKFIGQKYIHNQYNQDTLYKMRWNPANPGYPQYATDIGWAVKQITQIKNMYNLLENPLLRFNIIQYK
ncbi:N-acetylglucosaminidase, partial [Virgibacillus halodenitrificans]|uniref:N-acetylglucosaminidase n=1 Tax=Virgibacillus halodenitrificans TaxID=1482 RepID=UPI002DBC3BAF